MNSGHWPLAIGHLLPPRTPHLATLHPITQNNDKTRPFGVRNELRPCDYCRIRTRSPRALTARPIDPCTPHFATLIPTLATGHLSPPPSHPAPCFTTLATGHSLLATRHSPLATRHWSTIREVSLQQLNTGWRIQRCKVSKITLTVC